MHIDNNIKRKLLLVMKRIQSVENHIESLYMDDNMKTPVHLCNGQEAVAAGVCCALKKTDYISSNHRSHGHYLAKGGDLNKLISEFHCKETGCSKGYGGSMHVVDTSIGHMGSSSIVGGGIPIGTGLALAIKMKQQDMVSVIFFGDGAADEGVLYESINYAILKKLPAIYILENNQWAVCSHVSTRQFGDNIFHSAPETQLMTKKIDGNSVLEIFNTASIAVSRARKGEGPSFIECETYRILGHAGCKSQDANGYRKADEINYWKKKCPVKNFEDLLLKQNLISKAEIKEMESQIQTEIKDAFSFAFKSALPSSKEINKYLFKN